MVKKQPRIIYKVFIEDLQTTETKKLHLKLSAKHFASMSSNPVEHKNTNSKPTYRGISDVF